MPFETDLYNREVEKDAEINLVRAASNGDVDSFGRLCELYYSAMVAIAYTRLGDRGLAEDAAQEALFIAYRNVSKLRKMSHFGRWLLKICRNVASDMAKAKGKNKLILLQDCDSLSNNQDEQCSHVEVVRSIISELPVKTRELVYLRYYEKMSYQRIAKMLGISPEAVNGRLRRAKKAIAKNLCRKASVEVKL